MPATEAKTQDETPIRELVADKVAAMRARDAERIVAQYAPDTVLYNLAPPLRQPPSEATDLDNLRNWFSGFDGPIVYEVRDLDVTVGRDVAFAHCLTRLSTTPQGMTEPFDLWFRSTFGLRKIDGTWTVVHEHQSTPFYMDGVFGAAIDLKPED